MHSFAWSQGEVKVSLKITFTVIFTGTKTGAPMGHSDSNSLLSLYESKNKIDTNQYLQTW